MLQLETGTGAQSTATDFSLVNDKGVFNLSNQLPNLSENWIMHCGKTEFHELNFTAFLLITLKNNNNSIHELLLEKS